MCQCEDWTIILCTSILQGELASLACSKHGSRSLDAIWRRSSAKAREWVAAELAEKEAALNANPFGRFFAQKCALSTFKRAKADWAKVGVMPYTHYSL